MNKLLLLIIMFYIYACNNPNKATYIDFPEVSDIQSMRNITLDSIILAYPIIKRNEEYLCVADKDAKNQYFHLFTYPEFRYIKSFGTRGRGHNEIPSLIDFDIYDNQLYALSNHQKVYIYNLLTDSLPKTINIHDDISPIAINIINRESILFNTLSHYRVSVMNLKNNEIKKYFPIPIENPDVYNCQTWQSLISVNKDLLKIAIVTLGGEVIDILDIENNKTTRAIGEIGFPERLNFKDGFAPISNMCFTDVCCERNYIYALFLGEDYKKYMRKNEPMKYKVNIYDYDGKPIRQLMLNHNNITSFCIDETRNKILITVSDNENPLWEYDII